jgi:hypothetical protein
MTTILFALLGTSIRVESLVVLPRSLIQLRTARVRCNDFSSARPQRSNDDLDPRPLPIISDALERRVHAAAQSNVDFQKVLSALDETTSLRSSMKRSSDDDLLFDDERDSFRNNKPTPVVESWNIGLAAASAAAAASFIIWHNLYLSVFLMGFLFVAATMDDETVSGALARILGRTTIRSVQASEPKLKALARAVVTGETEVQELKKRIMVLEEEVGELRLWKDRRQKIEAATPYFSVEELKQCARDSGLAVGGTKNDLMMRLVEAQVLRLDNF